MSVCSPKLGHPEYYFQLQRTDTRTDSVEEVGNGLAYKKKLSNKTWTFKNGQKLGTKRRSFICDPTTGWIGEFSVVAV